MHIAGGSHGAKRKSYSLRRHVGIIVAAAVMAAGIFALANSNAATFASVSQAEQGSLNGPVSIVAGNEAIGASGGQAVRFGQSLPVTPPRPSTMGKRNFQLSNNSSSTKLTLTYYSNGPIDTTDTNVERVVFVIHGTDRNADDYAAYAYEAAVLADASPTTKTLVVGPRFVADSDITSGDSSLIYWDSQSWKDGGDSSTSPYSRPWRLSSYAALDQMVLAAKASFPELKSIGIIGHSAGGQYIARYAGGTGITGQLPGVDFRFAIANSSSYLYFDSRRYKNGTFGNLSSSEQSSCSGYDTYKYGMKSLVPYMSSTTSSNITSRFKARNVYILLGDQDNGDTNSLDTTCPANWQGAHRFERGSRYFDYLTVYYGGAQPNHKKLIVPGVAHDGEAMITSSQGRQAMYGQ